MDTDPVLAVGRLIWLATLALGWHYALDGVGGIALALLCVPVTRWYARLFGLDAS